MGVFLGTFFVSRFLGGPRRSDTEVVEYSDDTLERLAGRDGPALAGRLRLSFGLSSPIGFGLVIAFTTDLDAVWLSDGVDVDSVAASDARDPLRDEDFLVELVEGERVWFRRVVDPESFYKIHMKPFYPVSMRICKG